MPKKWKKLREISWRRMSGSRDHGRMVKKPCGGQSKQWGGQSRLRIGRKTPADQTRKSKRLRERDEEGNEANPGGNFKIFFSLNGILEGGEDGRKEVPHRELQKATGEPMGKYLPFLIQGRPARKIPSK